MVVLMLVTVLVQTCTTPAVIVQFNINRSYYADVLCINKNRPELACQGKCVLMQRLNADFQHNEEKTNKKLKNLLDNELILFYQNSHLLKLHDRFSMSFEKAICNTFYQNLSTQSVICGIFHPPTLVV